MKIAIMSMGNTKESLVSDKFGRAPFIMIYDTDVKKFTAIENIGAQSQHGAGTDTAELIIKNKISLLLTKEVGAKTYSVLAKRHIDIHLLNSSGTVSSTINKYLKNK